MIPPIIAATIATAAIMGPNMMRITENSNELMFCVPPFCVVGYI